MKGAGSCIILRQDTKVSYILAFIACFATWLITDINNNAHQMRHYFDVE